MHASLIRAALPSWTLLAILGLVTTTPRPAPGATTTYVVQGLDVPGGGVAGAVALSDLGWAAGTVTNSTGVVNGWRYIPGKGVELVLSDPARMERQRGSGRAGENREQRIPKRPGLPAARRILVAVLSLPPQRPPSPAANEAQTISRSLRT